MVTPMWKILVLKIRNFLLSIPVIKAEGEIIIVFTIIYSAQINTCVSQW